MKGPAVLADIVIGPHGPFTSWLFHVIARLVSGRSKRDVVRLDRFDSINLLTDPKPIILSHYPSQQLINAIEDGDVRVLYVIEDPLDVAKYLHGVLRLPPLDIVRSQTSSAVANLAVGRNGNGLYIERAAILPLRKLITSIVWHMRLDIRSDELEAAVIELAGQLGPEASCEAVLAAYNDHYSPPQRPEGGPPKTAVAEKFDDVVMAGLECLESLILVARGDLARPVVWPAAVFKFGDRPDGPPPLVADITGPARTLYYGPYFYLPPARYRVEAIMAFSDEIRNVPFLIEIHADRWLTTARIDSLRPNNYRGFCELDHIDATATVEIRLRNERDVDYGRLSLIELLFFVVA